MAPLKTRNKKLIALAVSQVLCLPVSHAATISVNSQCTLIQAINSANIANQEAGTDTGSCAAGDSGPNTIFLPAGSPISYSVGFPNTAFNLVTATPHIRSPITIEGNGRVIERSSGAATKFRLFSVIEGSNSHLTLNNLTIRGGNVDNTGSGGGIYVRGGLTLNNVTVTNNVCTNPINGGGGIFVNLNSSVTINNSTISNNTATGKGGGGISLFAGSSLTINESALSGNTTNEEGGAIYAAGVATLNNSTISGNTAGAGGGLYAKGGLYVYGSIVTGNSATLSNNLQSGGGGIMINGGNLFIRQNSEISSNQTEGSEGGGGVRVITAASVGLYNSTVSANMATRGYGGGLRISGSDTLDVTDSVVSSNIANGGAGLDINTPLTTSVYIINSRIRDNTAASFGGGMLANVASISILSSAISGNTASVGGGFALTRIEDSAVLMNSTISSNIATSLAAGVFIAGPFTSDNSTFSGNVGTAVYSRGGRLALNNSTVVGATNSSLIFLYGGNMTFKNSIVVNSLGTDCQGDEGAQVIANASNIISDGTCGTGAIPVDPLLLPLANNGGPTLTHALRSNSPPRNLGPASDCPATDQRGVERVFNDGFCDIGSFEFIDEQTCFVVPAANLNVVTFCL